MPNRGKRGGGRGGSKSSGGHRRGGKSGRGGGRGGPRRRNNPQPQPSTTTSTPSGGSRGRKVPRWQQLEQEERDRIAAEKFLSSADAPSKQRLFGTWTGLSPISTLHEWCTRHKWEKPVIRNTKPLKPSEGGHRCKVILRRKKEEHCIFTPIDMPTSALARHAAAVSGLHAMCHQQSLDLKLPPGEMRDLWFLLGRLKDQKDAKLEVREEREEKRKEIEKRKELERAALPIVTMSELARRLIKEALCARWSGDGRGVPSSSSSSGKKMKGPSKQFVRALQSMGWSTRDITSAYHTCAHRSTRTSPRGAKGRSKTNDDGGGPQGKDISLDDLIEWLCFHLDESALPERYRPRSEVTLHAFASNTSGDDSAGGHTHPRVGGGKPMASDTSGAPSTTSSAAEWKELHASAREACQPSNRFTQFYASFLRSFRAEYPEESMASSPMEDVIDARMEEIEVLQALLSPGMLHVVEEPCVANAGAMRVCVKMPVDTFTPKLQIKKKDLEGISNELWMEVCVRGVPKETSTPHYPAQLPDMLLVGGEALECIIHHHHPGGGGQPQSMMYQGLYHALHAEASTLVGLPMVFSLVEWLQGNLCNVLKGLAKKPHMPSASTSAIDDDPRGPTQGELLESSKPPATNNNKTPHATSKGSSTGGSSRASRRRPSSTRAPRVRRTHTRSAAACAALSAKLVEQRRATLHSKAYREGMGRVRASLPAWSHRTRVVEAIQGARVTIVVGQTGCGKSTQVPQFLLDAALEDGRGAHANIIITQPRRLSAVGLASRVAAERMESGVGTGAVGYHIRMDARTCAATRLLFCTTGILLRRLSGGDKTLDGVSHVVVDEVHERSVDSDFLLIILRELVKKRKDIKVVLMSATVDAELFKGYFESGNHIGRVPVVNIPGRTYPVQQNFLEEAVHQMVSSGHVASIKQLIGNESYRMPSRNKETEERRSAYLSKHAAKYGAKAANMLFDLSCMRVGEDANNVCVPLLAHIVRFICKESRKKKLDDSNNAILVFLPGMAEILSLHDELTSKGKANPNMWVVPLHSSVAIKDQQKAFNRPPKGVIKVVLSTNIAETSVTIDDVVAVVDSGLMNETAFDPSSKMTCLATTFAARANAEQRRGRAGRVRPGIAFHAYPRAVYEEHMLPQRPPEMKRVSLEGLCLQIKLFSPHVSAARFLSNALEPPEHAAVDSALNALEEVGAITRHRKQNHHHHHQQQQHPNNKKDFPKEGEDLTSLGKHLAALPVDVHVGKLMLYGAIFRCVDPILTIAAALSGRGPFRAPFDKREAANAAKLSLSMGNSDHMSLLNAYDQWLQARARGKEWEFCNEHFLSVVTLRNIMALKQRYCELLYEQGFVGDEETGPLTRSHLKRAERAAGKGSDGVAELCGKHWNRHAKSVRVLSAVLVSGLSPAILKLKLPQIKYKEIAAGATEIEGGVNSRDIRCYTKRDGRVFIHPSSVNFKATEYESPWMVYTEKVKTSKIFVRQSTMVRPFALLLFGGKVEVDHKEDILRVDDRWIQFRADAYVGVLIRATRRCLAELLEEKIENPSLDISQDPLVKLVVRLLRTDGRIVEKKSSVGYSYADGK